MSQSVYLVPAKDLLVRHPQGGYLKPEGDHVVLDTYWRRRMADESVDIGVPPGAHVHDMTLDPAGAHSHALHGPATTGSHHHDISVAPKNRKAATSKE